MKDFVLKNGEKLIVRNVCEDDAENIINYVNHVAGESDYLTFGLNEFEMTPEKEREFLRTCNTDPLQFFIVGEVKDEIVATLNFSARSRSRLCHRGEFGMSVLKKCWELGIGSIMIDTLLLWARRGGAIKKIDLQVRCDNSRAIALYRKKGFEIEGTLKKQLFVNGVYYDNYAMGLCIEDSECRKGKRITVCDYDSFWAEEFEELKKVFSYALSKHRVMIEHVGSTSVEGLAAKPILDIDIIVDSIEHAEEVRKPLEDLGYRYRGDLGIPLRFSYKAVDDTVPRVISGRKWMPQNLYVCVAGSVSLRNHLVFRNALRSRPELVHEYSELKRALAEKYADTDYSQAIDGYCEDKTEFITRILAERGISGDEISAITEANRA